MGSNNRSESAPDHVHDRDPSSSGMQKRFQKLSRNVSEAISSIKNSLNLDSVREINYQQQGGVGNGKGRVDQSCRKLVWATVVRNLTQLYPGSQLPEKLVSSIKKHYDSLPLRFNCLLFSRMFNSEFESFTILRFLRVRGFFEFF